MSIKVRINKIISCVLVTAMVLSCMANAAPALAYGVASASSIPVAYSYTGKQLYAQNFEEVTDVAAIGATSLSSSDGLTIASDASYGKYLEFDISKSTSNGGGRGARVRLDGIAVSSLQEYVIEFDAAIKASTAGGSAFSVAGADFRYKNGGGDSHMNTGVGSGYLLNLSSSAGGSTTYSVANGGTVTIPNNE